MLFSKEEIFEYKIIEKLAYVLNSSYWDFKRKGVLAFYFGNAYYTLDHFFNEIKGDLIYIESLYRNSLVSNTIEELEDYSESFFISIQKDYEAFVKGSLSDEEYIYLLLDKLGSYFYKIVHDDIFSEESSNFEIHPDFVSSAEKLYSLKDFPVKVEMIQNNFYDKLVILENKVDDIYNKSTFNSDQLEKKIDKFILNARVDFDSRVDSVLNNFSNRINDLQNNYETDLLLKIQSLNESYKDNKKNLEDLLGNVRLYESMVHKKTENEISKYYSAKSKEEKITYWGATVISILIIIVSIGLAWNGLDSYYQNYVSVGECVTLKSYKDCIDKLELIRNVSKDYAFYYLIMRLIFSILLFLTVIYTSRIAIRAYSHWRHSENMHLKLASLRPFISRLEPDEQSQIHKDLVPDYFGKDAGIVDGQNEKFKDLPANVSAVAIKAIEQIGSGGSSEGKESKKDESN